MMQLNRTMYMSTISVLQATCNSHTQVEQPATFCIVYGGLKSSKPILLFGGARHSGDCPLLTVAVLMCSCLAPAVQGL